jgi:glycosyltransferase involved in cell wall biosynthesis
MISQLKTKPMRMISVVIPVYWNSDSLPHLFEELKKVEEKLAEKELLLELIFVDDGSGDDSLQVLLEFKKKRSKLTVVIKHTRNFGSICALKTGFRYVTGDCFTILTADLQDPPELIPEMADKWMNGAKYVICRRRERDDPFWSKVFASIYYKLVRMIVFKDFPTGGYDLALMDQQMLPYLRDSGKNVNPSLFGHWLGFKPAVIDYKRRKRVYGKSRWTFAKKVNLLLDSLLGFSIIPIRFISTVGIFTSLASFLYGIFIIVNAILGRMDVRGFPTIVTLLAFLLGLIIVMLGVIGEYLWRTFDEVNKRPETVIDTVYK